MDKFRIDSHKLIYHIPRVYHWLQGENIYPIYMAVSLYRGCNHRCIFCALDFLKYRPNTLDKSCIKRFIPEATKKGVKAILYSGGGGVIFKAWNAPRAGTMHLGKYRLKKIMLRFFIRRMAMFFYHKNKAKSEKEDNNICIGCEHLGLINLDILSCHSFFSC